MMRSRHTVAAALALGFAAAHPAVAQSAAERDTLVLTLDASIQRALQVGPTARLALATRDATRKRAEAFGARFMPRLSLAGTLPNVNRAIIPVVQPDGSTLFIAQRQMQSSVQVRAVQSVLPTGGELFISSGLSRLDMMGRQDARFWTSTPFSIGFRQELFRPNALAWDRREQNVRVDVAERAYLEAREDAATSAVSAFFELYVANMLAANAAQNVIVNDTLYLLSKGRFDVGRIGENDLLQAELAVLRARASLDDARMSQERAAASLRIALDLPLDAPIALVDPTDIPKIEADPDAAVEYALRNRSTVREFELQTLQARRNEDLARANSRFNATINATAGFNQTSPVFGDAYRSLLDQQQLNVGIELPLVQWGAGRAQREAARIDRERVELSIEQQRQNLEQDARFAALQLTQAERQLRLAGLADSVADRRFEIARNRFLIGRIASTDLYIAQSEKDSARQGYITTLRGYWLAYFRLRRLTLYDFAAGRPLGD